jgi:hypothetical protein
VESSIVVHEGVHVVGDLVFVEDIADASTGRKGADVAVVELGGDQLPDEMILQGDDSRIAALIGEAYRGIDELAEADILEQPALSATEGGEKLVVDVENQQVLLDRQIDAAADLAADLDVCRVDRGERQGGILPGRSKGGGGCNRGHDDDTGTVHWLTPSEVTR